ncbi:hypothetical protein GDO86_004975 [Hymenochirus boettgeri]|nr:hypothetical protein GDO86_004975 [Hymenochirus boettgeri]
MFSSLKSANETKTLESVFTNPLRGSADKPKGTTTNGGSLLSAFGSTPDKPSKAEYNKHLSSLNYSVRDWIVKHVNANPLCDLTPIFKDYGKHLSSIEQKYGNISDSGSESDGGSQKDQTPTIPIFVSQKPESVATFSLGIKGSTSGTQVKSSAENKLQPAPTFNFGQKIDGSTNFLSSSSASGFSFSTGVSSLFGKDTKKGSVTPASLSQESESGGNNGEKGEEEEEEPPKVEIQEVKEDDAFYSKKCKLFYKKDNEFKEKGVGTLHLKPVASKKTQLLVRADTNLGNILLNILVQPSMPCSRMGKNNVMIVCVPNPPIEEKNPTVPVTLLIRVKTAEDADELHKILLEKKED